MATYYYAIVDAQDLVIGVEESSINKTDIYHVKISSNDQTLVGKWYDRKNSTEANPIFTAPPLHITAVADTDEINIAGTDQSLTERLNQLQEEINALKNAAPTGGAEVAAGNYVGSTKLEQTIALKFTPKAVIIFRANGEIYTAGNAYGGLAVTNSPAQGSSRAHIKLTENGFTVSKGGNTRTNETGEVYNYVAIQ